jgi:hypothetical protein
MSMATNQPPQSRRLPTSGSIHIAVPNIKHSGSVKGLVAINLRTMFTYRVQKCDLLGNAQRYVERPILKVLSDIAAVVFALILDLFRALHGLR